MEGEEGMLYILQYGRGLDVLSFLTPSAVVGEEGPVVARSSRDLWLLIPWDNFVSISKTELNPLF